MKITTHPKEEGIPLECLKAGEVFRRDGSLFVLSDFRPTDNRAWKVLRVSDGGLVDMPSFTQVYHKPDAVLYPNGICCGPVE